VLEEPEGPSGLSGWWLREGRPDQSAGGKVMEKTYTLELTEHEIKLIIRIVTRSVEIWSILQQTDDQVTSSLVTKIAEAREDA
jgi:hypothetical protein